MYKACIIGASGYSGAELARLLSEHPGFELSQLFVSSNSGDKGKLLSELYGNLSGKVDLPLKPLASTELHQLAEEMDYVFLATPHEASHDWVFELAQGQAVVLDLSGAHRFKDVNVYADFYGFEHKYSQLLQQTVYGLVDWYSQDISQAQVIAVPGCYPTASLLALKPVAQWIDPAVKPVINAVSGVSGAGRKASLTNSLCEVSLQAYGIKTHRHQPEISTYLGQDVIFTPHLGNFKRGILATCTLKLKAGTEQQQLAQAYTDAYQHNPLVRIKTSSPKLDDVVNSPYCDLYYQYDADDQYLIVVSVIDNLLKGAASQALQCANIKAGWDKHLGLVTGVLQ